MTRAWHDVSDMGLILKKRFMKLNTMAEKNKSITKNVHASNGMCQIVMQILNLKSESITNERLDKIEVILNNIPPSIIQEAVLKVEQQK